MNERKMDSDSSPSTMKASGIDWSEFAIADSKIIFQTPKYSDWQIETWPGTVFSILEDKKIPNRFQRWMQELVFGFKWRKK